MHTFYGYQIIESNLLTEDEVFVIHKEPGMPCEVRRTWRERLFSRPWRPWQRTTMITPLVPSRKILMHPAQAAKLRRHELLYGEAQLNLKRMGP